MKQLTSDPHAREKPCLRCGYSLRKLEDSRNCPECGLAIWITLSGNESLDLSNPAWLRKQSLGTTLILAAQIALLAILLCAWMSWLVDALMLVALAIVAYFILHHAGMLVLSCPERRYPDRLRAMRIALRIFAALGLVAIAVPLLTLRWPDWTMVLTMAIVSLLIPASNIVAFAYLHRIGRRIPSRRARVVVRVLFVAPFAWPFFSCAQFDDAHRSAVVMAAVAIYALTAFGLLAYLFRRLRQAACEADVAWITLPDPHPSNRPENMV